MAAVTPLSGITWVAGEISASQTAPAVVDLVGLQSAMVADLNEIIKNANYLILILPSGANKTALSTLVTTLS
ncbi:hypothetical protein G3N95_30030 [Paraburkholderia sp. Tr-20389]|uniref:hypothetical protein n=1 Tax=Paraburkholderia sp. Tr-20389 TaxID=2703903 RepID=UPI00197EEB03|nr:hypothetical protein [Paraburkholderia sp. Tr-20389]MBN3757214.1 hypothetical protein [Paraburkholderia sp. Tr-20389]